jgi:hypothetical protein
MNFREKILCQIVNIKDDNILIVKCNNVNERSAVNRLAHHMGYSTIAINSGKWRENFTFCQKNIRKCQSFNTMEWNHDDGDDHDYYSYYYYYHNNNSFDDVQVVYYYSKDERLEEFIECINIVDLDYNAVAIYPNYMKMKYIAFDEFVSRKDKVRKYNYKKEKGQLIITNEQEINIINNIYQPDLSMCYKNEILKGYDIL